MSIVSVGKAVLYVGGNKVGDLSGLEISEVVVDEPVAIKPEMLGGLRRGAQVSPTTLTMDAAAYEELRRAAFSVGRWVAPRRPERRPNRAARRRATALRRA